MPVENSAAEQKRASRAPAAKTDAPRRVRDDRVKNLLTDAPVSVAADLPLAQAIARMREAESGCAIVCEGERVAGIFAEGDFFAQVVGEEVDLNAPVRDFMARDVTALAPDATLGDALQMMIERGSCYLPVIEQGRLLGAVSISGLITYLAESYPKELMNLPPIPAQDLMLADGE